ncbi:MFS transporter [Collinsella tanakaei]|uniref:MFS transporter n=1 Tax=Collinsella tanakaei TaxID=626935 RepID=UPI0025A42E23|nr:MFS transporter [Collinsella tanakaei]MDM8246697.1 MFS transporter [Collinsella tanakaei]
MKQIDSRLLVFILTIGVFGILNTEMGVVGLIPYVAARYGVSVPDAGLLVSGFALVVAVAGPTMPLLFSCVNRKAVMLLALGVFSACNLFATVAPSFELLLAARVIPAAFHPLYVSMAMAVAQQTGDTAAERARNSARVFVGVSAGMVVGAPIAGMLASSVAFPVAMAFFAIVTIVALALTVAFVPSMPVEHALS